jgi:2-keto-3-deoxy-L-rhamnonate aldolase RhmA
MTKTAFRTRIRFAPPPVGTLITMNSPEAVEALSILGFDWLFIDMEHGPLDLGATQGLVRAMGNACLSLVRVPENSGVWIRRVLDTGCDGIIVPLVCSAEDARRAVDAARYPPDGHRSVGIGRAHGYGLGFADYVGSANDHVSVIIQIEHISAVESIEEILLVPGVDGVLVGPYDLSGSMNRLGDVRNAEVQAAITAVREACRVHEMPMGIFVLNPDDVQAEIEKGLNFIAIGTDLAFLTTRARYALGKGRGLQIR